MLVIGIIVAFILIVAHITEANITSSLNVTYAVFQVGNTYTQIVEFRRELISQAVNHSLLFRIGLILISHSFGYHLRHFVTGDVILALEGAIWIAVNNTGISQLCHRLVSPRITGYIREWIRCKGSGNPYQGSSCKKSCKLFHYDSPFDPMDTLTIHLSKH